MRNYRTLDERNADKSYEVKTERAEETTDVALEKETLNTVK